MRPLRAWFAILLLTGCATQDSVEPCVRKIDVVDAAVMNVGATQTLHATSSTRSGTCLGKEAVSWTTSNAAIAAIESSTDSTAVIRGMKNGTVTITTYLTRITNVRDSTTFQVKTPQDN